MTLDFYGPGPFGASPTDDLHRRATALGLRLELLTDAQDHLDDRLTALDRRISDEDLALVDAEVELERIAELRGLDTEDWWGWSD